MKTIECYFTVGKIIKHFIYVLFLFVLLIVINLFIPILLFTFLVIINSILSAGDSWVGRGRGPWEIVLLPQLEKNPRGNTV